MLNFAYK